MPKADKDIAGQIINFLRQNGGEAEIGLIGAGKRFDCHQGTVSHILCRLIERKVIKRTAEPNLTGTKRPARYALDERFKEGDGWREALKRKSSGGKAEAGPGITAGLSEQSTPAIPAKAHTDEGCLKYRVALSRELVEVYEGLEEARGRIARLQNEIGQLQDEIKVKDRKIEDLTGELEAEAEARKREINELAFMDLQLRKLRDKTSNPGKRIRFDGSGVIIAESEGLTDGS